MDERLHPGAPRRLTWRTLGEFTLRAAPGSDRRAAEQVGEMVGELSVPLEFVGRIGVAVTRAMLNGAGHDDTWQAAGVVRIHVLVSGAQTTAHNGRGWGFFLISKRSGSPQAEPASANPIIELFLYPEGDREAA